MNDTVKAKLQSLPTSPGVYFHKNAQGEIIYVGKAANLRNRVRQYFQKSRYRDPKTDALVAEIADIEWTEVESELDALFLEAELIRRYLPPYNILLRDDKSLVYVRINYKDSHPTVTITRRPMDDKAKYFGPYFSSQTVKKALRILRRIFPYSTHVIPPKRACLQYHLGLCPGLEENKTSLEDYRASLRKLMRYLRGERAELIRELEKEMKTYSKAKNYEQAAIVRNQLSAIKGLRRQIIFGDRELQDISKDRGLEQLSAVLGLKSFPKRIEGYDISHMSGTDNVASMVVFIGGLPSKTLYRKFKMKLKGNDDFAHMREVIGRRLSEQNRRDWTLANLMLIDGGKGQLSAAIEAREAAGLKIPMVGLAKRQETIIVSPENSMVNINTDSIQKAGGFVRQNAAFIEISLPHNTPTVKLLQRVRDESHRFAVTYHSLLKAKRQTASWLDEIPGVGPATRKKLLREFGSLAGIKQAPLSELAKTIGTKKANQLSLYLLQP